MSSPISASVGRPVVRAKARGWARHPHSSSITAGAGTVTRMGENRTYSSPQEPPEAGPHHARRVEAYSLADGRSPSPPSGPGTVMPGTGEVGSSDPYQASPVPPALAVAAAQRAQAPGATALLRGRWRPAAVRHGRSAMCRIGQGLKPPPRMPSQDRVRAWNLRGHLPHAARPSLSQAAPVAASRRFTRVS